MILFEWCILYIQYVRDKKKKKISIKLLKLTFNKLIKYFLNKKKINFQYN